MRYSRLAIHMLLGLLLTFGMVGTSLARQEPQTTEEAAPAVNQPAEPTLPPPAASIPQTTTTTGDTFYTVQPGDNLFRIALRFGKTTAELAQANGITNPGLIYVGQQLRIPGVAAAPTPVVVATATPVPGATGTYVVQRGDTLFKLAVRFNTTVAELVRLNNIVNPNIIYSGTTLIVPSAPGATIATDLPPAPTATVGLDVPTTAPEATADLAGAPEQGGGTPTVTGYGYARGIEAFLVDQDVASLTSQAASLGVTWVKQEILWRDFEAVKGEIDFATLDSIVSALRTHNLNILFTISAAPAWARTSTDENGPPDNFADYGVFVGALASRYAGQVQAYEIWNEPNLRREWNSTIYNISAASYIELLRVGYTSIKAADPNAVVISAGLAPTGFNDGVNAINDRLFLNALYVSGLGEISDAVGAHPLGWANPPDSVCCEAPVGVETHYQDSSFYFKDTLLAYRDVMVANNDGSTAIWVTKFGWGTSEDTDPPSETNIFVTYTTLGEQAIYDPRGFEVGAELGFVGPMFLDNLNGCQVQLKGAESCYYSLLGPDGALRPVFAAVQALNQGATDTVAPEPAPTVEEMLLPPNEETSDLLATVESAEIAFPTELPTLEVPPVETPEVTG
jgi:LysM repeat protein